MRDIKRIQPFMDKVTALWEKHQDLRFQQFLVWLLNEANKIDNTDQFFWEEDKWEQILEKIENRVDSNQ